MLPQKHTLTAKQKVLVNISQDTIPSTDALVFHAGPTGPSADDPQVIPQPSPHYQVIPQPSPRHTADRGDARPNLSADMVGPVRRDPRQIHPLILLPRPAPHRPVQDRRAPVDAAGEPRSRAGIRQEQVKGRLHGSSGARRGAQRICGLH